MADSPGPLGAQEAELAERLGKTQEASSDDFQKDPVLSGFLDELSGRVNKRPIVEYEGKMQPVSIWLVFDILIFSAASFKEMQQVKGLLV